MSKFNVGDKVRCLKDSLCKSFTKGREYVVAQVYSYGVGVEKDDVGRRGNGMAACNFELVTAAATFSPPEPGFKVGDRVRILQGDGSVPTGTEAIVQSCYMGHVVVSARVNGRAWLFSQGSEFFELISETPKQKLGEFRTYYKPDEEPKKHKCHCDRDQVLWHGCICGGV